MLNRNDEGYIRQIESQVTSYGELVEALESTVAEQSERLERSHGTEALLAAMVESYDDAVIGIGLDLRVMVWNRAAEQLLGYTAQEAIGQDPTTLYVPADERATARKNILDDFENLKHQPDVVRRLEGPIMRKDGSTFDAAIIICVSSTHAAECSAGRSCWPTSASANASSASRRCWRRSSKAPTTRL